MLGCKCTSKFVLKNYKSIPFQPIITTPAITSTVPIIWAVKIGSLKIKCACIMVDTGPTLEMIATLLDPIFFNPAEIKNVGITVATTASKIPYNQNVVLPDRMTVKLPLIKKCSSTPKQATVIA